MKRRTKWLIALFLFGLLIVSIPAAAIGVLAFRYTHPPKMALHTTPGSFGLSYQDVSFPSVEDDHVTLRGWLIQAKNQQRRIAIFAHGYSENRESADVALYMAKSLRERGIASLMFDFRASGESDGAETSLGYHEKKDLLGAIQYAKRLGYQQIGLVGFSMGASTALDLAPEVPEVQAVVADSAFSNLDKYLEKKLEHNQLTDVVPFLPKLVLWEMQMLTGIKPDQVQPIAAMPELKGKGVFLIHAGGDSVIPAAESRRLSEACPSLNAMLWVSNTDGHVGTFYVAREEYLKRTSAFLTYYLSKELPVEQLDQDAAVAFNERRSKL
ncbi:MAG: alpha/beta fold hydrolase [Tumebacillaceae bacterium]